MQSTLPMSKLAAMDLTNKHVFLRADLNVPLSPTGAILDDFRLQETLPTIELIQKKGGMVILATHIGRPTKFDPALSTEHLISWFERRGIDVLFTPDLAHAAQIHFDSNKIILLENLRFFPGEQGHNKEFAQKLAKLADVYVNDAFGTLHREDSSISLMPQFFVPNARTIGPLIERELRALEPIKNPTHPFVVILGGGKVSTKLAFIECLLDNADTIILCPAIVFTFLKACGKPIGKSLVDNDAVAHMQKIIDKAQAKNVKLIFPSDYLIAQDTIDGALSVVNADNFPANGIGLGIGPATIAQITPIIMNAKTLFYNAAMGFLNKPDTCNATRDLLQVVAQSSAYSVVGGGDSCAMAHYFGIDKNIAYFSTGGGVTLEYLCNKPLPGLEALK